MKSAKVREYTIVALLVAMAVVIPMYSFKVVIPPFSMTLGAHIPVFIAMFISPYAVVLATIGNIFGFLPLGPVVMARAATHLIFGLIGAYMLRKKMNYLVVIGATMLIHAIAESIVALGFMYWTISNGGAAQASTWLVFFGTVVHHSLDFAVATPILLALSKAKYIKYSITEGISFKKKKREAE